MDRSRLWKKVIIVLSAPIFISAKIMCNDGTQSPSCYDCHGGCCSGHGGCADNYKFNDNDNNNHANDNYVTTPYEWYETKDDEDEKIYLNKPIKEKSSSSMSKIILNIIFTEAPILIILLSIIIDIIKYFRNK